VVAFLVACNGEPEPTRPAAPHRAPPDTAGLCQAVCDREAACGRPGPCPERCRAEAPDTAKLKPDYLWRLLSCLDDVECTYVVGGTAFRWCDEALGRTLPTTTALRRFCFESSRRAAACGRAADADQGECLNRFRTVDDPALERAIACLTQPCASVPACLAKTLGY
jgi:hypothetical protein